MRHPGEEREVYILRIFMRGARPDESIVETIEDIRGKRKGMFKTCKDLMV
jgi:hypothetical protein